MSRRAAWWPYALCLGGAVLFAQCSAPPETRPPFGHTDAVAPPVDSDDVMDTRRHYVLMTDGGDTIATEVVDDGDGWVESVLRLTRRGEVHRVFVSVDADGAPRRWDVHRAWPSSGGRMEERWRVLSTADSLFVVQGALIGVPVSITAMDAPAQATPWHDASVALLELPGRRAGTTMTAVSMPPADRRRVVRARRVHTDSIQLVHPDGDWHLTVDSTGRVHRAASPSRRLQWHRVAAPARDGHARRVSTAGLTSVPVSLHAPDGVRLEGEFVRPLAATPRAVVLFVSGSGPQDRDLAVPGFASYRPFGELAEALARQGVASVRMDDRGAGGSGGAAFFATRRDEVRDMRAVLGWLRTHEALRDVPVVLIGHSDGAHVALDLAADDTSIRRVVLLAAPSRAGRELARAQRRAWFDRHTVPSADSGRAVPTMGGREASLAAAEATTERLASLDPWMRDWLGHDPKVDLRTLRADVLLVHGERDQQVPVAQADELAALLRARGAGVVQLHRVPDVNHLLLADSLGDPQGYGRLSSRTLPASVRDAIVHWVIRAGGGG